MTNTMIERVSDALADAQARGWNGHYVLARVAITAMREPSPEQDAAFESDLGWMADTEMGNNQRAAWLEENRKRWRTMIDAVLGVGGKG